MILIVAEKPSAGKDIARIVGATESRDGYMEGNGYLVTWGLGHLVTLKDPEDDDESLKQWRLDDLPLPLPSGIKPIKETYKQLKVIRSLVDRTDIEYLINAGDAGREGLLIQDRIYRMCNNKHPVKILWASSLTDEAITKAMNNLHDSNEPEFVNLLNEAEARAEADQVYGYNYTRLITLLFGSPGTVLSYGACQTPLLNLIASRDDEIKNFVSKPFWNVIAQYSGNFSGTLIDESGKVINYADKDIPTGIINKLPHTGKVIKCETVEKKEKAPALFNLAEIQNRMGKKYGIKPDETLAIAQRLYEKYKILSYPRTDSRYLSTDLYSEIVQHVECCYFGKFVPFIDKINFDYIEMDKAYFNNNKVSDHHALIPTINRDIPDIYDKLDTMEKNFFDEIVIALIAIFYPPYRYEASEILVDVDQYIFESTGTHILDQGYKEVYSILPSGNKKKKEREDEEQLLPQLSEGNEIEIKEMALKEGKTKPPTSYNPGNITKLMEKYRIGTSATSASIIKTLEDRRFIVLDDKTKKYTATDSGKELISIIPDELKDKNMRISFEESLSSVNAGTLTKEEFLTGIINDIRKNITELKSKASGSQTRIGAISVLGKCPVCGNDVVPGKFGAYCKGKCGMSLGMAMGKKLSDAQLSALLSGKKTLLKGLKKKSGDGTYDAYVIPDGIEDYSYTDKDGNSHSGKRFKYKMEFPNHKKNN